MTFIMKADGSCMAQVTSVESPFGGIVNSEVLCPSNGFRKSSLMVILLGPAVVGGAAESLLHRRIDLLISPSDLGYFAAGWGAG
jgi:hypothetical protein